MVTIEMAMIALNSPLPSTVTMAIASRSAGKARNTSMTRMITVSTPRPKKPASSPRIVPTMTANVTAAKPEMSEIRAP